MFLNNGKTESCRLTYTKLDNLAQQIANHLQNFTEPGDRALLLYPPGLDFIVAFFGCLYAGVIAIPLYPPRPNRSINRLKAIMALPTSWYKMYNQIQYLRWWVTTRIKTY
ncbi:AMP-binding protein [Crocosphaera sp. XPORK-15E]|uniref:AMP-binding protein n=1 Tax=Crocosphaera sp. XPORK-15E TaxID=3110247 RepID=UPI002B1F9545|nr:AMP-binding protein [Crocosphaera sp. XPORK-15E]MEA5534506.1 AMP-binding protein [Crocosphaera sp. XPORK-15E]